MQENICWSNKVASLGSFGHPHTIYRHHLRETKIISWEKKRTKTNILAKERKHIIERERARWREDEGKMHHFSTVVSPLIAQIANQSHI